MHDVENDDIFILGSDGVFDNLHTAQIIDLIRPFIENTNTISNPAQVAEIISREAEKYSNLRDYNSPFAESAIAHNKNYWGGKPDDITVVVSQINLAKAETIENYFE